MRYALLICMLAVSKNALAIELSSSSDIQLIWSTVGFIFKITVFVFFAKLILNLLRTYPSAKPNKIVSHEKPVVIPMSKESFTSKRLEIFSDSDIDKLYNQIMYKVNRLKREGSNDYVINNAEILLKDAKSVVAGLIDIHELGELYNDSADKGKYNAGWQGDTKNIIGPAIDRLKVIDSKVRAIAEEEVKRIIESMKISPHSQTINSFEYKIDELKRRGYSALSSIANSTNPKDAERKIILNNIINSDLDNLFNSYKQSAGTEQIDVPTDDFFGISTSSEPIGADTVFSLVLERIDTLITDIEHEHDEAELSAVIDELSASLKYYDNRVAEHSAR